MKQGCQLPLKKEIFELMKKEQLSEEKYKKTGKKVFDL